jgi:hypothetical protein
MAGLSRQVEFAGGYRSILMSWYQSNIGDSPLFLEIFVEIPPVGDSTRLGCGLFTEIKYRYKQSVKR